MARRTQVTVSLTPALRAWVEQRIRAGEFTDINECIEHALRRAQCITSADELRAAALQGIRSGPTRRLTGRDWARYRSEITRREAQRRQPRKSA